MTDKVIALFGILLATVFSLNLLALGFQHQDSVRSILAQASATVQIGDESVDSTTNAVHDTLDRTTSPETTSPPQPETESQQSPSSPPSSTSTTEGTAQETNAGEPHSSVTTAPYQAAPRVIETEVERQETFLRSTEGERREELHRLEGERRRLEAAREAATRFNSAVLRTVTNVDKAINTEVERTVEVARFDEAKRQRILQEIRKKIGINTTELRSDVRETLFADSESLGSVLKSPLAEVELLLQSEVGQQVDLSSTAREIETVAKRDTEELAREHETLEKAGGLALYRDEDRDGVSDFDEIQIYKTDPYNAHTAGSLLTDGERVLLGYNAKVNTKERVFVESPIGAPEATLSTLFEVTEMSLTSTIELREAATTTASTRKIERIHVAGTGAPNGFVTLFIYSTPIVVTVKADGDGAWRYVLDQELATGEHELYVATINNEGRIVAKSPAIPFIKTAEALEFTPYTGERSTPETDPIDILRDNLLVFAVLALLLIGVLGVLIVGILQIRRSPLPPPV